MIVIVIISHYYLTHPFTWFIFQILCNVKSMKLFWSMWEANISQRQPSRGVLRKRYSENMQQIHRRTPMPKCDVNLVALQLYWNRTSAWVFSCKFVVYFQNTFFYEHLWAAASYLSIKTTEIVKRSYEYWSSIVT